MAIAGVAVLAAASAAGWAHWNRNLAPFVRARMVANILASRSPCDVANPAAHSKTLADRFPRMIATAAGCSPADDAEWASAELQRLADGHPSALARAASVERSADVRWAFLDLVDDDPAYVRHVAADDRLEHVAVHAVLRLDRPAGRALTEAQEAALKSDRVESLARLRNVLRRGHCGALAGFDLLGAAPTGDDLRTAADALGRAGSDPLSEIPRSVQRSCLERLSDRGARRSRATSGEPDGRPKGRPRAERGAPSTDGGFGARQE